MKNEIILYQLDELPLHIEVQIDEENETFWLSLNQIAQLFERNKSVISRHLKNIFKEGELNQEATVAKNATVQMEAGREVTREIEYYNLDAILSVGCRVNSKRGTQFRVWANGVLKEYLLKGYAINQRMDELPEHIEVRIDNNTVWLNQTQMVTLFAQTKQNISLHINNCFREKELEAGSVVKKSLTTAKDGEKYKYSVPEMKF